MIRLALLPESMFALSVLLTYLAHSTLWFLVAWAASHPGLGLSSAARSRVWRAALVGPLAGTVLALLVADLWRVPAVELTLAAPPPATVELPVLADLDPEAPLPRHHLAGPATILPGPERSPAAPAPVDLGVLLLAALAATAGCRLAILGVRQLRFWRRLRGRRPIYTGAACERLRALAARADLPFPARLSISPLARGPMALGRGEICLPPRALDELPGPALSAVLAHELAHLERQDNGWLTAGAVIEAVLFFQPLTRIARRQLSAAAELACDEWAVELTESPVDLARSIAIVAAWQLGRHEAVPVAAMARTPIDGDVVDRVKRLLAEPLPATDDRAGGRSRLVFGVLVACGLVAPAIGGPGQLQAAGVPMALPKATQAANRFLAPPVNEYDLDWQGDWDNDWNGDKRPRRPVRVRVPRPPRPPRPPMAPMAPLPPMPPMPAMPPMPGSAANVGAVAAKMAQLGMKLAELHASRAGETFTEADQAKVKEVERQMAQLQKQLDVEEKRFSRDMEDWGKRYEQRFGKDWELKMEQWGQQYAQRMEEWQRRHGRDMERWSRDWNRRMADSQRREMSLDLRRRSEEQRERQEEMRERQEEMRQRQEERRKRQEEVRKQYELGRKMYEQQRRDQPPQPPAPQPAKVPR